MRKIYPLLCVLFLIYWGCEDEQEDGPITFDKTYDGISGHSVQQTTDGVWLIRTDSEGRTE